MQHILEFDKFFENNEVVVDLQRFERALVEPTLRFIKAAATAWEMNFEALQHLVNEDSPERYHIKELLLKWYDALFDDYQTIHGLWQGHAFKNSGHYFLTIFGDTNMGMHVDDVFKSKDKEKMQAALNLGRAKDATIWATNMTNAYKRVESFYMNALRNLAACLKYIGIDVSGLGGLHNRPNEYWKEKFEVENIRKLIDGSGQYGMKPNIINEYIKEFLNWVEDQSNSEKVIEFGYHRHR